MASGSNMAALSRRAMFGGRPARRAEPAVRPPWTTESSILERCTACGDCIAACPETILAADGTGRPRVLQGAGECTFCGSCADICAAGVFDSAISPPWQVTVEIGQKCLLTSGIVCRSCADACEPLALRFRMTRGSAGKLDLDEDVCTGCGACAAVCPASAITLRTGAPDDG